MRNFVALFRGLRLDIVLVLLEMSDGLGKGIPPDFGGIDKKSNCVLGKTHKKKYFLLFGPEPPSKKKSTKGKIDEKNVNQVPPEF